MSRSLTHYVHQCHTHPLPAPLLSPLTPCRQVFSPRRSLPMPCGRERFKPFPIKRHHGSAGTGRPLGVPPLPVPSSGRSPLRSHRESAAAGGCPLPPGAFLGCRGGGQAPPPPLPLPSPPPQAPPPRPARRTHVPAPSGGARRRGGREPPPPPPPRHRPLRTATGIATATATGPGTATASHHGRRLPAGQRLGAAPGRRPGGPVRLQRLGRRLPPLRAALRGRPAGLLGERLGGGGLEPLRALRRGQRQRRRRRALRAHGRGALGGHGHRHHGPVLRGVRRGALRQLLGHVCHRQVGAAPPGPPPPSRRGTGVALGRRRGGEWKGALGKGPGREKNREEETCDGAAGLGAALRGDALRPRRAAAPLLSARPGLKFAPLRWAGRVLELVVAVCEDALTDRRCTSPQPTPDQRQEQITNGIAAERLSPPGRIDALPQVLLCMFISVCICMCVYTSVRVHVCKNAGVETSASSPAALSHVATFSPASCRRALQGHSQARLPRVTNLIAVNL